jgi:7-dehydrocholesterol reductase
MPLVYDFYRGSELHPHVLGCDAKQLTVSRIGIMGWQLLIIAAFLDSQLTAADIATLTMQTVYIIKFFW